MHGNLRVKNCVRKNWTRKISHERGVCAIGSCDCWLLAKRKEKGNAFGRTFSCGVCRLLLLQCVFLLDSCYRGRYVDRTHPRLLQDPYRVDGKVAKICTLRKAHFHWDNACRPASCTVAHLVALPESVLEFILIHIIVEI